MAGQKSKAVERERETWLIDGEKGIVLSYTAESGLWRRGYLTHRSHRQDDERGFRREESGDGYSGKVSKNSTVRVRSATEDTLFDMGEQRCYDRNYGAQGMNQSFEREPTSDKVSGKSSGSPCFRASSARAETVSCADEKSFIACASIDGKQIVQGDCKRFKRERARNGKFSEISTKFVDSETVPYGNKGDWFANNTSPFSKRSHGKADGPQTLKCQDDQRRSKRERINDDKSSERCKKLAKIDTPFSRDKVSLVQSSLYSAEEKCNDGDDGSEIQNNNTIYSGMEGEGSLNRGEGGLNRGEERDHRSPKSEHSYCNALREGSVTSHLSIHSMEEDRVKEKCNDGDDGFEILNNNTFHSGMEGEGGLNRGEERDHSSLESAHSYCNSLCEGSVASHLHSIEGDHVNNHSEYYETASQDIEEKESSTQSSSSPSVINMLQACRSIHDFQRVSKISEGVYGVVFKAQDKKTGEIVAVKKVKMDRENDGFPITSLRVINILLSMDHPSIIVVKEVAVDKDLKSVYMVMEHMEQDLAGLLATHKSSFSQSEVKYMMLQLLEGVQYIHSHWVLHRDLKPSNVLIDSQGMLKICDFGLARKYGSPLKTYTHKVVSLWYRDPALLLGWGKYSTALDMWSLGCIMAELLGKAPLFEGCSELDQLKKIVAVLGSPDETLLQDKLSGVQFNFLRMPSKSKLREMFPPMSSTGKTPLSQRGFDLLSRLLMYDPSKRINAEEAVRHDWFREDPLPKPLTS